MTYEPNKIIKPVVKYIHHDVEVSTFEETKGHHREYCLCHNHCKFFKPDLPAIENCQLAQENFEYDVKYGMTTPVIECPKYEQV